MSFLKEFKEFISKGNVIDLAVGVVIGGAFGKIVATIVTDIIMPPVGIIIGGINFTDLKIILKEAGIDALTGKTMAAVTINYGNFIQEVVSFLIIALTVFLFIVKPVNAMKKKQVGAPSPLPVTSNEEKLLGEIRDILKNREGKV